MKNILKIWKQNKVFHETFALRFGCYLFNHADSKIIYLKGPVIIFGIVYRAFRAEKLNIFLKYFYLSDEKEQCFYMT